MRMDSSCRGETVHCFPTKWNALLARPRARRSRSDISHGPRAADTQEALLNELNELMPRK